MAVQTCSVCLLECLEVLSLQLYIYCYVCLHVCTTMLLLPRCQDNPERAQHILWSAIQRFEQLPLHSMPAFLYIACSVEGEANEDMGVRGGA